MADYVCHLSVIQAQKTLIFGCSCAYLITFFIKLCETPPYYEPSGLHRWHNLIAVCNEAAAKKGGVSL